MPDDGSARWLSLETFSYFLRFEDMAGLPYYFQHVAAVCNQIVIGSAQQLLTKRRTKRTSHPGVFIFFDSPGLRGFNMI